MKYLIRYRFINDETRFHETVIEINVPGTNESKFLPQRLDVFFRENQDKIVIQKIVKL